MKIIKTEEITIDENTYVREYYDNGTKVEYVKSDPQPQPTPEPQAPSFEDTILSAITDLYEILLGGE